MNPSRLLRGVLAASMALAFFAFYVTPAVAQHTQQAETHDAEQDEHHWWLNHISVTAGGASALEEKETSFTSGLEYERRLTDLWGVGLLWEFVFGDQEREMVWGVPLSAHAVAELRLVVAPLLESVKERDEEGNKLKGGLRVGADYEFELGRRFSVAPLFFVDILSGETILVYGVAGGIFF